MCTVTARCAVKSNCIGLFGGSFDPPHLGHLALLQAALDELPLDELWVVPAGVPVHRTLTTRIAPELRLGWLAALLAGMAKVRLIDWEVRREMATPTIHTLRRLHGERPEAAIVLILGADAAAGLPGWIDYPEHRKLCHLALAMRSGQEAESLPGWRQLATAQELATGAGGIWRLQSRLPDISATTIRRTIERGEEARPMLPPLLAEELICAYRAPQEQNE